MKKLRTWILLITSLVIIAGGALIWSINSPEIDDYYIMYIRREKSEFELVQSFAIALRRNHEIAYQIVVPDLHPRLDKWMSTHPPQRCSEKAHIVGGGTGTNIGYDALFSCIVREDSNKYYRFHVDDIVVENLKIVEWGEITEGFR